uniref:Uncharacterized protein n=1 Tax=Rhizophora mucronata TaxID=61149 RepID=A0A2P2QY37_RHIMU
MENNQGHHEHFKSLLRDNI